MFKESAKEFKNLRSVTIAALLVALHTVLSVFSIYITDSLRVSISFVANCIIGLFFGPVVTCVCAALGDIVGYIAKPVGPYFPGWTLSAAISGLAYGMVFYKKYPNVVQSENGSKLKSNKLKHNKLKMISIICTQILTASGIILWFIMPFFSLIEKTDGEDKQVIMIFEKCSAYNIIRDYNKHMNMTVCILAIIVICAFIVLLFTNMVKKKMIPMQISLYTACIITLAAYSDNKTIIMESGFYVLIGILYIISIINIVIQLSEQGIDIIFLLKCFLVMAFIAVFVNGFLGTYWVSVMRGKGFMFYFTSRMIKNLLQLPVNTMLAYEVICKIKEINFTKYFANTRKGY